jgi:hypothetical protein
MMNEMKHTNLDVVDEKVESVSGVPSPSTDEDIESTKLVPCTVRFRRETDEAFRVLADDYGVSKAEIIRLAAAGGMSKYLGDIKYIDRKQGSIINRNIVATANILQEISGQLRRIGVNYNQQTKLMHIANKKAELKESSSTDIWLMRQAEKEIKELEQNEKEILNNHELVDSKVLEDLVSRVEKASEQLGGVLWRIHE